jgi:hypothetical protein
VLFDEFIYPGNIRFRRGRGAGQEVSIVNSKTGIAYIAFDGHRRIASGDLAEVARAAKERLDRRNDASILMFEADTSAPVDIDFRGNVADVLARLPPAATVQAAADENDAQPAARGPGRPKLGVVAREVTLLPRHWDWLAGQSGGASVTLRRLVEEARRGSEHKDRVRHAQEAAYRFVSVMAGDRPNYEEAMRALFGGDALRFEKLIADWPADIRSHALQLAEPALRREKRTSAG